MKKQVIVALALAVGFFSFGQKNELKAAEKAIKANNFAEAKTAIMSAESLIGAADDKTKAKFYLLKAKALYANGTASDEDTTASLEALDMALNASSTKYKSDTEALKTSMLNTFLTNANSNLSAKKYLNSSKDFNRAYRMSPKDTLYLYYAASTAVSSQDYDTSLKYYEELRDLGYDGSEVSYTAINKETNVEETFDNKNMRDLSVKAGTHIAPKDALGKSKSAEIIKNIALIYVSKGDNEKALEAMAAARSQNPDDLSLLLTEANVQLKMGNMDKFKVLMEEATQMDPNNAELQYNLGVVSADAGDKESARKYYEKAIELDPKYGDAYTNIAVLILDDEQAIVEEMNSLGTSAADDRKYEELKGKRIELYKSAIPFLEKSLEVKPDSIDAMKTLMNIYSATGETDKFKMMKDKVDNIGN